MFPRYRNINILKFMNVLSYSLFSWSHLITEIVKNKFRDVNSISPIKSEELEVELKTTNTKAARLKGN